MLKFEEKKSVAKRLIRMFLLLKGLARCNDQIKCSSFWCVHWLLCKLWERCKMFVAAKRDTLQENETVFFFLHMCLCYYFEFKNCGLWSYISSIRMLNSTIPVLLKYLKYVCCMHIDIMYHVVCCWLQFKISAVWMCFSLMYIFSINSVNDCIQKRTYLRNW